MTCRRRFKYAHLRHSNDTGYTTGRFMIGTLWLSSLEDQSPFGIWNAARI